MTRRRGIPLAEAGTVTTARRRAWLSRLVLASAVLGLVAVALTVALERHGSAAERPAARTSTVVVLDLSGSVTGPAYGAIERTLAGVLRGVGDAGSVGLVLFSDVAFEALPVGTPARELRHYLRFFRTPKLDPDRPYVGLAPNPWSSAFSAGTMISSGLQLARRSIAEAGLRRARVLLVSDLADSPLDLGGLRHELLAYARDPRLDLAVVAAPPLVRGAAAPYRRILGRDAVTIGTPPAERGEPVPASVAGAVGARTPLALLLAAALIAVALAVNELLNAPLSWRPLGVGREADG